eukprot:c1730_g1_i1.p1 GENE.c1730_g1_i1~~c1730_g1_i1.p1  ORF type:complete len:198 (+),score=23.07 c1730_g1_i1:134-727(+)
MALVIAMVTALGASLHTSQDANQLPETKWVELASLMPAAQSTTASGQAQYPLGSNGPPSSTLSEGKCTETNQEIDPWWRVDLGHNRHRIFQVQILNRGDCCGERLEGYQVFVTDTESFSKNHTYNCSSGSVESGQWTHASCSGLQGRYVFITIPNRAEHLTLCGVKVFGERIGEINSRYLLLVLNVLNCRPVFRVAR